jgi:hypothetical protein
MVPVSPCARALPRLPHPGKHLLLALLGLADLALTWALIRHGFGVVYEANPVASWCLRHYGWAGLAAFKAGSLLAGSGLCVLISWRRPRAAGRVLALGCAATAAVVLYSGHLAVACSGPLDRVRDLRESGARLERASAEAQELYRLQDRLADDLAAGRLDLAGAVAELGQAAQARGEPLLRVLRVNDPASSDDQSLALRLIRRTLFRHGATNRALAGRLEGEFGSLFGAPPRPAQGGPTATAGPLRADGAGRAGRDRL